MPGIQGVSLQWQIEEGVAVSAFIVERDDDGKGFRVAGGVRAHEGKRLYTFTDEGDRGQVFRYRIRMHHIDGEISYSEVHQVYPSATGQLSLYPNPVVNQLYIETGSLECESCNVTLYSVDGNRISLPESAVDQISSRIRLDLPASLPTGLYLVQLSGPKYSSFGRIWKR